jgi:carbon storage regulator
MEGSCPVLVLTRNANQSIMIGHDIVVTVLEIRGDQVRIGIRAPRSVDVHREEVYAALQRANRTAATSTEKTLSALGKLPTPPGKKAKAPEPGKDDPSESDK